MKKGKGIFDRQIINDPKLQYGIVSFFVVLGALNFAFFVIILKMVESKMLVEINLLEENARKYFLVIFNDLADVVFKSTLAFGGFVVLFSFIGGVLLLQHISGPSYAIKKFLSDLKTNSNPRYPLKLRKHDFFNEHADLLNQVYEKYELNKNKSDNS
jgi:hypothetical protein